MNLFNLMWLWWRLIWLLIDHLMTRKRNSILYGISASFDRAALQISQKTSISAFQFIVFIVGNCCGLCSWHIVVKVTTLLLLKSNLAINLKQDFSFIMDSMDKRGRHLCRKSPMLCNRMSREAKNKWVKDQTLLC